ncbi:hypothetical protein J2752_002941 [Halarchaeum rubridurum]|uniref:Uncharacterized protein n=1 Tax=Halarchaeum rubridurum TaxID=489911 RepID=A0A830G459_9EURY|nr:hypothetical protein [Halarchaeum rubridurum]MBP1956010.1 hypothetical protein [Halarchaeum rubridurum]GGM73729.1 hypothetical protein GCM10009017_24560 [Halarchaeum rubridurum]
MAESGLAAGYQRSSPWPVFLALGLVLSEVGVFLAGVLLPVAVGGLLLLEMYIIGIFRESGYARTLSRPALGIGSLFTTAGLVLLAATTYWIRGVTVLAAGVLAAIGAIVCWLYETRQL